MLVFRSLIFFMGIYFEICRVGVVVNWCTPPTTPPPIYMHPHSSYVRRFLFVGVSESRRLNYVNLIHTLRRKKKRKQSPSTFEIHLPPSKVEVPSWPAGCTYKKGFVELTCVGGPTLRPTHAHTLSSTVSAQPRRPSNQPCQRVRSPTSRWTRTRPSQSRRSRMGRICQSRRRLIGKWRHQRRR